MGLSITRGLLALPAGGCGLKTSQARERAFRSSSLVPCAPRR
jgi:hypothetical protein